MLPKWPKPVEIIRTHILNMYIIYRCIHRSLGLCAMMQILGSEKFPQTRLAALRVFGLPAEASLPLSSYPSSFKDSVFSIVTGNSGTPLSRDSQHTFFCHHVHSPAPVLLKTRMANCNWLKPKIMMLSTELQTDQRLHNHSLPRPCF